MVALAPNEIRKILNAAAAEILFDANDESYANFDTFCSRYARAILNAGYVSVEPSEQADMILDYRVSSSSEDKEGAFGKVWRGLTLEGETVALKIFRYEVREKPLLLKSFRRGIRSLRILSEHQLPGIVGFKAAAEIPPVLVMEWIEGANLQDAVPTKRIKTWFSCLRIARDLARIVFSAHNVPERVLHRDLRPANIMLRDFFVDPDESEVVVLDFDLSWHVGSLEQSVFAGSGSAYLAPEQLSAVKGATSRSAAVDSFGFGMTLYFLLSEREPTSAFSSEWPHIVRSNVGKRRCDEWKSLPERVSRLIIACTRIDQHRRPLFSQIVYEIETMFNAAMNPHEVTDMEFLAEEAFARAPGMRGYEALDVGGFIRRSPSGLSVQLGAASSAASSLNLRISFDQIGVERYTNLKAIGDYFKSLAARLCSEGFDYKGGAKTLNISAGNFVLEYDIFLADWEAFIRFCSLFSESTNRLTTILGRS
jgi:serine/threonine protein kinase